MPQSPDSFTLNFIDPVDASNTTVVASITVNDDIDNTASINIEKDFFTPANGFTFVLEDNRIQLLVGFLSRGWKVCLTINGKVNGYFYIFNYHLDYSRDGGTRLTIECKDLLEYMAQGCVYPNMPNGNSSPASNDSNQFDSSITLLQALTLITANFVRVTGEPIEVIGTDDASLSVASGGNVGLRTPRGKNATRTSLSTSLKHTTCPDRGESYLAYMLRLAKLYGFNIKMSNSNLYNIVVKPPTYDRTSPILFNLYHFIGTDNANLNNILDGKIEFNLDRQPSVVFVECNTTGDGNFHRNTLKGVAVNELTAYDYPSDIQDDSIPEPIEMVATALTILTTGVLGTGVQFSRQLFNRDLYHMRALIGVDIRTRVSLPLYTVSVNAHSGTEAAFAAKMILAEAQDTYVLMTYRVSGWSQNGVVFQPDMMVNVYDDIIPSLQGKQIPMWIRKVNFTASRDRGFETILTLSLPYTHDFELSDAS